jgi:uncharacterized protein YjbI with pentapeptide repeats
MDAKDMLGIIAALVPVLATGLFGYWQFLNQRRSIQYSENIKSLYSASKEEVLASIANLVTFKKSPQMRRITQDVLINRLYTELDYNVCNAIGSQLVSMIERNNPQELNYIIQRLIEINYNYFLQTYGIGQRAADLKDILGKVEKDYAEQLKHKDDETKVTGLAADIKKRVTEKWNEYNTVKDLNDYRLMWHKQVIADTIGMILSSATSRQFNNISVNFVANDFNYCTFRNIAIHNCSVKKSAFSQALLQQVKLDNVYINDAIFSSSIYEDMELSNGKIIKTTFHGSSFRNVKFCNIQMEDVCFLGCSFIDCSFDNKVTGINPVSMFKCEFSGIPPLFINAVTNLSNGDFASYLETTKISGSRLSSIKEYYEKWFNKPLEPLAAPLPIIKEEVKNK